MGDNVAKFYQLPKHFAARTDLTVAAKLAFAVLKDRQGKNDKAWPSHRKVAEDMGVSRLTAMRAVNELIGKKFVVVNKRHGQSSEYVCQSDTCINSIPVSDLYRSSIASIQPRVSTLDTELTHRTNPRTKPKKAASKKPSAALVEFKQYFVTEWAEKSGSGKKYPWKGAKDAKGANAVLEACGDDLPLLKSVVDAYFAERSEFYIGHTMAKLGMDVARFMVKATEPVDDVEARMKATGDQVRAELKKMEAGAAT